MRLCSIRPVTLIGLSLLAAGAMCAGAQQPQKTSNPILSDKLAAAKSVFVKKAGGSAIAYDVFSSDLEGWGRFTLVNTAEKADIIVGISGPSSDSDVTVSNSTKESPDTHKPETSSGATIGSSAPVKLVVYDAKSRTPLWSATENVKFALKGKAKENNLVEAAERIFVKFHDRVEPPAKQ